MEQQSNQQLRDDLEEIQEKAKILNSTLLAIYAAQEHNTHDNSLYLGALHGAVNLTQDLLKAVMEIIQSISHEEARLEAANS